MAGKKIDQVPQSKVLELVKLIQEKDLDWEGLIQLQTQVNHLIFEKMADDE